jgi:hypothetical protein
MVHLVYTSKEKRKFSATDLKKLLMNARICNREVGVTGILVYQAGIFLQALEGEEEAVRTTFSRIDKDPRHGDVSVLHRNASIDKRRMFGEWSMGFADTNGVAQVLRGFIDVNRGLGLSDLDETRTVNILNAFSENSSQLSA